VLSCSIPLLSLPVGGVVRHGSQRQI
jgi:hypothetical protein